MTPRIRYGLCKIKAVATRKLYGRIRNTVRCAALTTMITMILTMNFVNWLVISTVRRGPRLIREALLQDAGIGELEADDITDSWVDEMVALSQAEREVLQESLRPLAQFTRSENSPSKPSTQQHCYCLHGQPVSTAIC